MSSRRAAVVCEGPSDFPILEALIGRLWPEVEHVTCLQPELDDVGKPLTRSAGWSEVRAWCEENAPRLHELVSGDFGPAIDLLVIALDVDIAIHAGIIDPPKHLDAYATPRLCKAVKQWLGSPKRKLPGLTVIGLPAMATEAWAIAALFPKEKHPEAESSPAEFLALKKKLPRRADNKPAKPLPIFRDFGARVAQRLDHVREVCPEAEKLCSKIETRRAVVEGVV